MYQFLSRNKEVLYVGKAINLRSRVSSYFTNHAILGEKTRIMVGQIDRLDITVVESEIESLLLEAFLIKKFSPKYNVRMADGKSYPLIQISVKEKYPAILFARKAEDGKSVYFGPYPSSGSVKMVLRLLRKVFPYVSVRNHPKKVCLYHHLGLCPCPQAFDSEPMRKNYKKHIRRIIGILEGKSQKIQKELEKERDTLIKKESFEEAREVQRQIDALSYITQPFRQAFEYDTNPNLRSDIRQQEADDLANTLRDNSLPVSKLNKIECYDISNIQGTNATGSMVVFVNGEKESNLYRKYKIRRKNTPNDFAMMEEVLIRRLKHTEWDYPDLIVVDGGKGQISSALKALEKYKVQIPLIGLAKREEKIIIPIHRHSGDEQSEDSRIDSGRIPSGFSRKTVDEKQFVEVSLPKNAPALTLLMRIRNEAHRFAITYHKKLRSSAVLR